MHPIIDKLKARTVIDSITGCWLLDGIENRLKYGMVGDVEFSKVPIFVHRLSAHLYLGLDLKDSKQLALHKVECKNKNCWNPEHLYIGTHSDNMMDCIKSGTRRSRVPDLPRTHCINGHKMDAANTYEYKKGGYTQYNCRKCGAENARKSKEKRKQQKQQTAT